ncbi:DUF6518 family protein [Actinacidiphila glaucinigra]|uniref:DUF6518 family protein n=1 Tax=Actinacidiphila glaucinigra TaxID=235986 RepID=UPI002DDB1E6B|nr:DUF6518 family protein [Actinacidiphila glaucinigra]WSD65205.1 DUF6518 family protein [Actinacidiphila glaucinigra]
MYRGWDSPREPPSACCPLPGASNQIPNSGAVWSASAFAAGAILASRASLLIAAVTGLLTELGLVIGYYGYAEFGRDGMGALDMPLFWASAACVAGPLFGVAGVWSRTGRNSWRRVAGTAALAGVFGGEGVGYAWVHHYWTQATGCFVVLLLVSLLLPRTLKDRALTLSVAVVFSLLSYVVVGAAGHVVNDAPNIGVVPGLTDAKLQATLSAMVPPELEVTDHGSQQGENAYVVVTDGKGASRLDVTVQTGMSSTKDDLFSGSTTLPDGTLLKTSKQADGADGLVMWSADSLRTDGLRVLVVAYNSAGFELPVTRETPALTMEQLTAMATDKKWKSLP